MKKKVKLEDLLNILDKNCHGEYNQCFKIPNGVCIRKCNECKTSSHNQADWLKFMTKLIINGNFYTAIKILNYTACSVRRNEAKANHTILIDCSYCPFYDSNSRLCFCHNNNYAKNSKEYFNLLIQKILDYEKSLTKK